MRSKRLRENACNVYNEWLLLHLMSSCKSIRYQFNRKMVKDMISSQKQCTNGQ